jgi:ATP-dependent RNA circularization protein (DNA/RNA ligase family)
MKRKSQRSVLKLLIKHNITRARITKYGHNYYIVDRDCLICTYTLETLAGVYPFQTKELCSWVMKKLNIIYDDTQTTPSVGV